MLRRPTQMARILFLFIGLGITFAAPFNEEQEVSYNPWEDFRYHVQLDVIGKYRMFWTPDDETQTITFEVHVEALGYVGFGISPNGGMTGGDVVIGWVLDDGTPVFHDRHAFGEYEPIIDESQDVTLLAANQNDTHTILRFSKPYVTCDENDRDITDDTIRVIYSFTDTDPEDITGLDYHGSSNRGTRSVVLLYYNDIAESLPDDAISMDILITEHTVPEKRTTYWCEFIKVQQLEQKHHVVMFEPVIQPGNEGLVHHVVLYACYGDMDDDHHGQAWDCIYNVMPGRDNCYSVMFVWAVGGNPFYFPNHTGIPLFSPADNTPVFMMMEVHYDNPENIEGRKDQTGFRLHMTPTLRENDIGVMIVGASVDRAVMIPPHYHDLTYRGYCMPECLQTVLNTTDDNPENDRMNVFAIFHHSHLLGIKMKTRIYRDGEEIEPLLDDANYDFNFQETRKLKEERLIHPTDLLLLDCGYDSSEREDFTLGGFATVDEMCESFLYYYPAHRVTSCISHPPRSESIQMIDDITLELSNQFPHFRITGPPQYVNMSTLEVLETLDWTNATVRDKYQEIILRENANMARICFTGEKGQELELPYLGKSPELGDDWIDPDDGQCDQLKLKRKMESSEKEQSLNKIRH